MIDRFLEKKLGSAMQNRPVVALLGPRQVGKTTLALKIAESNIEKPAPYLDLELESDLAKLQEAEDFLRRYEKQLLIIDEVQRKPRLFQLLRGLVDIRKRAGEKAGHFLLLGSASRDLLQQTSETLAGRIRFIELTPFLILEISKDSSQKEELEKLWFRGGFPDSFLAESDQESWDWRSDFISTYLERDIPRMGPNLPAEQMRRFWTMIAHQHGQQVNLSAIASSLGTSHTTVRTYLDTLTDFYMLRQLPPWSGNLKKRLIKSPKIYLRDSGLLHRLLGIKHFESLLGNPHLGASWEGFVVENILNVLSDDWEAFYYRSRAGAEIDLVLNGPDRQTVAIEIKRSLHPTPSKGFHLASEDIGATQKWLVYPNEEDFPLAGGTEAKGFFGAVKEISGW